MTQCVFDMDRLRQHLQSIRGLGLHKKMYLLVGVGALSGPQMAEVINAHAPGVVVPDHVIQRLRGVTPERRRAEGLKICLEQIHELRETAGVCGIDLVDLQSRLSYPAAEIAEAAGLLPRPAVPED